MPIVFSSGLAVTWGGRLALSLLTMCRAARAAAIQFKAAEAGPIGRECFGTDLLHTRALSSADLPNTQGGHGQRADDCFRERDNQVNIKHSGVRYGVKNKNKRIDLITVFYFLGFFNAWSTLKTILHIAGWQAYHEWVSTFKGGVTASH